MFKIKHTSKRITYFVCAKCNEEDYFFGAAAPLFCRKCKTMIPGPLDLSLCESERVAYHLDKDKDIFH